jgi:hypothetical protein
MQNTFPRFFLSLHPPEKIYIKSNLPKLSKMYVRELLCMYMCVYIYIYIYIHTHIYVCVCVFIVIMKTTVFDSCNYEILLIISEHGSEVSLLQYDILLKHVFPNLYQKQL